MGIAYIDGGKRVEISPIYYKYDACCIIDLGDARSIVDINYLQQQLDLDQEENDFYNQMY